MYRFGGGTFHFDAGVAADAKKWVEAIKLAMAQNKKSQTESKNSPSLISKATDSLGQLSRVQQLFILAFFDQSDGNEETGSTLSKNSLDIIKQDFNTTEAVIRYLLQNILNPLRRTLSFHATTEEGRSQETKADHGEILKVR